jgi:cytochrome c5
MGAKRVPVFACLIAAPAVSAWAAAAAAATGEEVYQRTCAACHASGTAGAPKFGDKQAWSKLIKESQATLTADGYVGIRAMPPKGGDPNLGLEDFAKAVAYMARAAGADWKDPDAAAMKRIAAAVERAQARAAKAAKK